MTAVAEPASGPAAANDPPDVAAIEVDQVDLGRQGEPVLQQLSFTLMPGESLVVTGANGSGKSMLLRCLVEGRAIDTGSIRLFGREHREVAARRRLAWLPERVLLPATLPGQALLGLDVLGWLGGRYGMRWSAAELRLLGTSHGLGDDLLLQAASGYSPGLLKMIGLIAAVASDRELLLLDEPFAGLDGSAREWWLGRLMRLGAEQRTLVIATRSMAAIGRRVGQVVLLGEGRMLYAGRAATLLARSIGGPAPQRAAGPVSRG